MGFLLLSVEYPSDDDKERFVRAAGSHSNAASPIHWFLAASATDDQWRRVLKSLRENVEDLLFLDNDTSKSTPLRPLRPNDDNYEAFSGALWKPKISVSHKHSLPPAMCALMGCDNETTIYPYFGRCANCTKLSPKMNQCSRCKIVRYCSRDCQAQHWKMVHKTSCVKAQPFSLYKSMNGNDGFLISPDECNRLQMALAKDTNIDGNEVIQCFQAYFDVVKDLGGCFIL